MGYKKDCTMWLWMKWHCKLLHICMVYTKHAPKRQQFHIAPAMQWPNSTVSTPLWRIPSFLKQAMKGYNHSFAIKRIQSLICNQKDTITHLQSKGYNHSFAIKRIQSLICNQKDTIIHSESISHKKSAVSLLKSGEQCYVKAINNT